VIVCPRCAATVGGPQLSCKSCAFVANNGRWFDFEPRDVIDSFFDEVEFDHRFVTERTHYWHRARRELLTSVLESHVPPPSRVLEVGCGCGNTSKAFQSAGYQVWSADLSENALTHASTQGLERLCRVSITDLPFKNEFDAVVSFDVVEHIPDHERCVEQLRDALAPGGTLILTVPAHPSLWSSWDAIQHHVRRFKPSEVRALLEAAGLEVVTVRQFFAALVLPVLAGAVWDRLKANTNDTSVTAEQHRAMKAPPILNQLAYGALAVERHLLNTPLPGVGTSVLAVARRKEGS
jgi:2-polyprenyl-3-methyl-5-hydroxy-6-metoxy-1,4-benzoquinol methylase